MRRLRPLGVAGVVALVASMSGATGALAHSHFVGSEPSDGAALKDAPRQVILTFSQAVVAPLTTVRLVDSQGREHQASATFDPGNPSRVLVKLPALPSDAYRISFTVRDTVDLHATSGSIVLGVGTAASLTTEAPATTAPRAFEVGLRWFGLVGLTLLLGGLATALLVVPKWQSRSPSVDGSALQKRLLLLALAGSVATAVAETGLLLDQAAGIGPFGSTLSVLVRTSGFGERWVASMALLLLLGPAIWYLRRRASCDPVLGLGDTATGRASQGLAAAVCLLAFAECVVLAVSGHTGADATPTPVGVAVRALHVVGAGVWAGGLAALILAVLTQPKAGWRNPGAARNLLLAFSWLAAPAFVLLAATGLLLSGTDVVSITALLSTPYGAILLAKVALVALVGVLAFRHHRYARRSSPADSGSGSGTGTAALTRSLVLETVGAVVLLGLAAGLGATAPARGAQFDGAPPTAIPSTQTSTVKDLVIQTSLQPNLPGRNLLAVLVLNTRRPAPAPINSVMVELQRTIPGSSRTVVTATRGEGSRYDGGAVDLAAGDLQLAVTVTRPGLPPVHAVIPWVVDSPPVAQHPTVISTAPIGPIVNAMALAVALAALAVAARSRYPRARSTA